MIQLIYASRSSCAFTANELADLLAKSRVNNERLDISGLLLHQDGAFIQVLEGPELNVLALYERIKQDTRHREISMLLQTKISARSFADWRMGFFNAEGRSGLPPGFSDFFSDQFLPGLFSARPSLARKLLLEFREGQWRREVESGITTPSAPQPVAPPLEAPLVNG